MDTVGIVGLGLIGSALVRRLVSQGETPRIFDLRPDLVEAGVADGAIAAHSCRELAENCDILLVCVQTDEQCNDAVAGELGLLEGAKLGACIAVLSTVKPSTISSLATLAANQQYVLLASSTGSYPGTLLLGTLLPLNQDLPLWSLSANGHAG